MIPNGRNEDGTLKNIECVYTSPQTLTLTSGWGTGNETFFINGYNLDIHRGSQACFVSEVRPSTIYANSFWFNPKENQHYYTTDTGASWAPFYSAKAFEISFTSGVVEALKPNTVFHTLDYNDQSTISGWGMPSKKLITLTLGVSGTRYTAQANGWFCLEKASTAANQYMYIGMSSLAFGTIQYSTTSSQNLEQIFPVKKGQEILINYTLGGETKGFRFVYTEGEQ